METLAFVHEGLGNSSYLAQVAADAAVLIDPDRSARRYLEAAEARGWHVLGVLDTHLHADFVTGSLEVRHATGASLHLPAEAGAGFVHHGVRPGERIGLGDAEIEVIASPGHTPEHLSYAVREDTAPLRLFSGGALIVGGAARTDLMAPELTEVLTRAQFHTLHEAFAGLPDETELLPTHGGGSFCSVASGARRTSTLGEERRANPLLAHHEEEEFVRWFPSTFPAVPAYFSRMRGVNQAGPTLREAIADPPRLDPDSFDAARERGALVIDARSRRKYAAGHIPGALSIPFRDSFATWVGWLVPPETSLLFVADRAPIGEVVDQCLLVGYERFAGLLDGGIAAWEAAGRPVVTIAFAGPAEIERAILGGAIAVDVREPDEFAEGHLEGAVHIPLGQLADRVGELPAGRAVVAYCAAGDRASTAASILERAGVGTVINLDGGADGWRDEGYQLIA